MTKLDNHFQEVYDELLRLARVQRLTRVSPTLNTVAVVSESYLKLRQAATREWEGPEHVKATAAHVMVNVLRSYLRKKATNKRGRGIVPLSIQSDPLAENIASGADVEQEWLQRIDIFEVLEKEQPRRSTVAKMRFCGYKIAEMAESLGVSEPTIKRDLAHLRSVLSVYFALQAD